SMQPTEIESPLCALGRSTPGRLCNAGMLELLYATGLRVSELSRVKVEDLVLDAGFLRTIGKRSKERVVPFGDSATKTILAYLEEARSHFDKRGRDPHLFLSNRGRPMSRQ